MSFDSWVHSCQARGHFHGPAPSCLSLHVAWWSPSWVLLLCLASQRGGNPSTLGSPLLLLCCCAVSVHHVDTSTCVWACSWFPGRGEGHSDSTAASVSVEGPWILQGRGASRSLCWECPRTTHIRTRHDAQTLASPSLLSSPTTGQFVFLLSGGAQDFLRVRRNPYSFSELKREFREFLL